MAFKFHRVAPPIPIRVTFYGNEVEAQKFVSVATDYSHDLEQSMDFQNIKTANSENVAIGQSGSLAIIRCTSSYGLRNIEITVPVAKGAKKEKLQECFCSPCFVMGIIEKIKTVPSEDDYYAGARIAYDILVCLEDKYLLLEDLEVMASGWAEYYEGQYVLVSIDIESISDPVPNCCIDKTCLFNDLTNTEKLVESCFQITPLSVVGKMVKSYDKD